MKFTLPAFLSLFLLERNNGAQHFRDTFHFKRFCLHNLMKLQKMWGRGPNNLFCWYGVRVNSDVPLFRSFTLMFNREEPRLELAILFLHWKIWLVLLPEIFQWIFEYCWELHLGIKMFQYFPVRVKSYALQTGQNCSQWCIFQDFVQPGVKCLCNLYFFLISLRKLSLLCIPHGIFFHSIQPVFSFSAHILLFLQYTFLPSKDFNFGFTK